MREIDEDPWESCRGLLLPAATTITVPRWPKPSSAASPPHTATVNINVVFLDTYLLPPSLDPHGTAAIHFHYTRHLRTTSYHAPPILYLLTCPPGRTYQRQDLELKNSRGYTLHITIIYLHLCLKIFLFLVLYIAMEIVDVRLMPIKLLLLFFHQILMFLHLTSCGQAYLMGTMLPLVGMKKMISRWRCYI